MNRVEWGENTTDEWDTNLDGKVDEIQVEPFQKSCEQCSRLGEENAKLREALAKILGCSSLKKAWAVAMEATNGT